MGRLIYKQPRFYFDVNKKQWWILEGHSLGWKKLGTDEAYALGLYRAVLSQPCNFVDTDRSEYRHAVSSTVAGLDRKFGHPRRRSYGVHRKVSGATGARIVSRDYSSANEVPSRSSSSEEKVQPVDGAESSREGRQAPDSGRAVPKARRAPNPEGASSDPPEAADKGSEKLLTQINDLIESTSQMKLICKARELSNQKAKTNTLRSTARHLTYVNNGGLAGCLKTVAEEREKMGKSKKGAPLAKNAQLQEMIQRAKAMAAKTMDEPKEPDPEPAAKKAAPPKKSQLRSNVKKYTTVFGAAALKDLRMNQNLPDVTFEGSSDEDSDEEHKGKGRRGSSKDRKGGRSHSSSHGGGRDKTGAQE